MGSFKRRRTDCAGQMEFDFHPPAAPLQRSAANLAPAEDKPAPGCPTDREVAQSRARGRSLQDLADGLREGLCEATSLDIRLRITNNSSTMMSLRYGSGGDVVNVGLHYMFLEAPKEIRKALAQWVLRPKGKVAGRKLEAFIADRQHLIVARPSRPAAVRTSGRYFDLRMLYDAVNAAEFEGAVKAPITWGKMPTLKRRRSIRFGSYSPGEDLIRIHPLLDQEFVPHFFVRYIVFHEMLHAFMGIEEGDDGRRKIHPPAFRVREGAYPDFKRAVRWMDEEKNLRKLLRASKA